MHATTSTVAEKPSESDFERLAWIPLFCGWMLTLVCLDWPNRLGPGTLAELDPIALIKLGARGMSLLLLGYVIALLWRHPRRPVVMSMLLPFGTFVLWGIVSTMWSARKAISSGQAGSLLVLWMLAIVYALLSRSERDNSTVYRHLCLGALFMSTLLLVTNLAMPSWAALDRPGFMASVGLTHPNTAGATASLGLILLVAGRMFWNWNWARWLLLPGILIHGPLLYISHNRASVALTVVLVGLAMAAYLDRRLLAAMVVAFSTFVVVTLFFDAGMELLGAGVSFVDEFVRRGESDQTLSSINGRTEMWAAIWDSYLESPLIGHGYFVSSKAGFLKVWNLEGNWTAHNMWLQVLVSTGLVGAVLVTWGLLRPLPLLARGLLSDPGDRRLAFLLFLLTCWYLGWGLLCPSFLGHVTPLSVIFYSSLGLAIGNSIALTRDTHDSQPKAEQAAWPMSAAGAC